MTNALDGIREYWVAALDERRGEPAPREGDLASHLLHSTFDDRPLTDDELLDMLTVLVLAGLDTTRATLGYIFWHLAMHPEQRRRLIDEPELIPSAVEEALRYYPIVFGDGRKVTRDAEFYGVQLKQGDMVYALVAGANRDPRAYERADEFVARPQAQRPHGLRQRPAPLPGHAPGAARAPDRGPGVAARDPRLPHRHRRGAERARRRRDDDAHAACRSCGT